MFRLGEEEVVVEASLHLKLRDGVAHDPSIELELVGEQLELRSIKLDGKDLEQGRYRLEPGKLLLSQPPAEFRLDTVVAIRPQDNTSLEGLYRSNGMFCTQCEAEGFRKITYFLDRPDVMARYTTSIQGDASRYPVMLSNGNLIRRETQADGSVIATWEDPFPKPSYLFALVAGDLKAHRGTFRTRSGREVILEIWVEPHDLERCDHALRSLQRAMEWDERRFGLEYDLDIYMVVAVSHFNMGAMENKGLNVFNSKYVLASPATATDEDYDGIESVIAHEYFHNWTGNRVTCRDWFQLTLKEGLTVFRDQWFSSDMGSPAVNRIEDVKNLRAVQFAEDRGPMAHPIRPEAYIEMNNFYTSTVYEKGAEVVGMYKTLLGEDGFLAGMKLYFERHDGQAVTCDDFRAAMADANQVDLSQFEHWYMQAGTPRVIVTAAHDPRAATFSLTFEQSAPIALQETYLPRHIPIRASLLGADGRELALRCERVTAEGSTAVESKAKDTELVLECRDAKETFVFHGVAERPVSSLLRGFSAPIELIVDLSADELAFLLANDSDPFARWEAGQRLALNVLRARVDGVDSEVARATEARFLSAWRSVLAAEGIDPAMKALLIDLPDERVIAAEYERVNAAAIHQARVALLERLIEIGESDLLAIHHARASVTYSMDRDEAAQRKLANQALRLLTYGGHRSAVSLAFAKFERADNMTDLQVALGCLAERVTPERETSLATFYTRWRHDALVMDKWFAVQAMSAAPDTLDRVFALQSHPDYSLTVPNRVRALLGTFAMRNPVHFHAPSGKGYEFVGEQIIALDAINPSVAARMVSAFNQLERFEPSLAQMQRAQLERIIAAPTCSRDVREIAGRALRQT